MPDVLLGEVPVERGGTEVDLALLRFMMDFLRKWEVNVPRRSGNALSDDSAFLERRRPPSQGDPIARLHASRGATFAARPYDEDVPCGRCGSQAAAPELGNEATVFVSSSSPRIDRNVFA